MAETKVVTPPPPKKRRWLRWLGITCGALVVFLVVGYFVATSSGFFKSVILPRVSKAINAQVTVSDASISPFKEVVLHNLKVQTTGPEPLVTASEVRARYSLMDIIRGNIHVDDVTLSSPTVTLVINPDGTSNLDPITKSQLSKPNQPKPAEPKSSKPAEVDIKKVTLTQATVKEVKMHPGGTQDTLELANVNISVEDIKNGQTGKLTLGADIHMQNHPPAPATAGSLDAKLNGSFAFALTAALKPSSIKGSTKLDVTKADGSLAQAAQLGANVECDITPTEIKQAALHFSRGGTSLGQLHAFGPFDLAKAEGQLTVELLGIDKQLLNVAGATSGLDFGSTAVNSTNQIEITKAGAMVSLNGALNLNKLQVTRASQTTPTMDVHAAYNLTVDSAQSNAQVRNFTLTGTQQGREWLKGELTSPMTIAWGNAANAVGDSALNIVVTGFDLKDWKPFLGENPPTGVLDSQLKLLSQQAGKQLTFDLSSQLKDLNAQFGSNRLTQATVTVEVHGGAKNLQQIELKNYKFELARQNEALVTASGAGTVNTTNRTSDLDLTVQANLARLVQLAPQPNMSVSSGSAQLKGHVSQKQDDQSITGSFALSDFSAKIGSNIFQNFSTTADLDVALTPLEVQIRKFDGQLSSAGKPGGSFDVTGTYSRTNKPSQLVAKLVGFNADGLRTFLEPSLGEKKLVSVALNGNATLQYDPNGPASVKSELQVTNLVVSDPKNQFPATPLEAKLAVDAGMQKQVIDIRQCQVTLSPTAKATNQVQLSGHIDMTKTDAIEGNLKLASDSLDLTSYYDLFQGPKAAATTAKAATKPAPTREKPTAASSQAAAEKEPDPVKLPMHNFTAEMSFHRIYLREMELDDLQATAKIDGGHVVLNPCKVGVNGGPITANVDLDLSIPGYKYNLSLDGKSIPMAPLVDTFQPDRKGQIGGGLSASAQITGAGTTGASLQKSLSGKFDVNSTNLNLSVINIRSKVLTTLINVVATIPELFSNPEGAASGLLGNITGGLAGTKGGLADDLQKSPINTIALKGEIGAGKITVEQALVQSSVFQATAPGTITIAPVLTNSAIQFPVSIALGHAEAQKVGLGSATTPANGYDKLPDFYTEVGTIGEPKSQINKMALVGSVAKGVTSLVPKAGNVVKGLGGNLGGILGNSSGTTSTNQTGNAAGGLLRGLGSMLGGNSGTNASTNNASTNKPINNLLKGLFK